MDKTCFGDQRCRCSSRMQLPLLAWPTAIEVANETDPAALYAAGYYRCHACTLNAAHKTRRWSTRALGSRKNPACSSALSACSEPAIRCTTSPAQDPAAARLRLTAGCSSSADDVRCLMTCKYARSSPAPSPELQVRRVCWTVRPSYLLCAPHNICPVML